MGEENVRVCAAYNVTGFPTVKVTVVQTNKRNLEVLITSYLGYFFSWVGAGIYFLNLSWVDWTDVFCMNAGLKIFSFPWFETFPLPRFTVCHVEKSRGVEHVPSQRLPGNSTSEEGWILFTFYWWSGIKCVTFWEMTRLSVNHKHLLTHVNIKKLL